MSIRRKGKAMSRVARGNYAIDSRQVTRSGYPGGSSDSFEQSGRDLGR